MSTRQEIVDMIDLYTKAEKAVLSGQSYSISGRSLTRADIAQIRKGRHEWEQKLASHDMRSRGGTNNHSLASWT